MKLIGKGSAAGGVRWALGFMNVFVAAAAALLTLLALAAWIAPSFAAGLIDGLADAEGANALGPDGGSLVLATSFTLAALAAGMVWLIINRLRRIFATLTAGDPFRPENVRWLQTIGIALAVINLAGIALPVLIPDAAREALTIDDTAIDLSDWLGVLIVFILAEVFREGARMRDEQAHLV